MSRQTEAPSLDNFMNICFDILIKKWIIEKVNDKW